MDVRHARSPYSYRDDVSVPDFPDDQPIIIFDGHCVLCSKWAQFVIRHDRNKKFKLLAAQSPLGHALYAHYGLDPVDYQTNILIADGSAWFESESSIRMLEGLGPRGPGLRLRAYCRGSFATAPMPWSPATGSGYSGGAKPASRRRPISKSAFFVKRLQKYTASAIVKVRLPFKR